MIKKVTKGDLLQLIIMHQIQVRYFLKGKEPRIDYENLTTIKNFPGMFRLEDRKCYWNGEIEPIETDYSTSNYTMQVILRFT